MKMIPCWFSTGQLLVAVEEDPEFAQGFPLRVVNLTTGEMGEVMYENLDELIEGEGLDRNEVHGLKIKRSTRGAVDATVYDAPYKEKDEPN